jgi:penicillin-binding protein 2
VIDQKRSYVFGPMLSSILGYVGEATEDEIKRGLPYYLGESVGRMGLEKSFQEQLSGRLGKEVFEMQASGKLLRPVDRVEPVAGVDIDLTIDASFSAYIYEQLGGRKGAVVVSNPKTGEIYAMVSSPSYDPEHLSDALKDENKQTPMLQRAVTGQYPPGSTFKLMTALAGLQNGAITTDTSVTDEGSLKVGEFSFGNWYYSQYGRVEGEVKLTKALQRSNDIYFYKVAEWLGVEALARFARSFHFGSRTGIELPAESAGVIPDSVWKQKTIGEPWYLGDTYHMGIGQGDVLTTPLQLNQMTSAIANNGVWCAPHLIKKNTVKCEDLGVSAENLAAVVEGMKAACAPGGTAFPFFDGKPVVVACKTGTAEFGPKDEKGRRKTHALITVMAPAERPTVVVTVLLEADEDHPFLEGSADAGPVAKKIVSWWMGKK